MSVARDVGLVLLLTGMLASNLTGGPVDDLLEPWAGRAFHLLGIRQFWSMFAPNPVHAARFVEARTVAPDGTRSVLVPTGEPPDRGAFWAWGYDRIHKLHKQVALQPDRLAAPYAEALCRLHRVDGAVELVVVHRAAPAPAARLAGEAPARSVSTLGVYPCR